MSSKPRLVTHKRIAERAGVSRSMVSQVLAGNDDPALPWHRVLRADGRIAFPPGSAGFEEQCRRLRAEGVTVAQGRVKRQPGGQDLDAAVWGPDT